jgi:hypothetical protein
VDIKAICDKAIYDERLAVNNEFECEDSRECRRDFERDIRRCMRTWRPPIDYHAKPLTPKQFQFYKDPRRIGIGKKDARQVARDPGVKEGQWGWSCESMQLVYTKATRAGELTKYAKNAVCE